MDFSRLQFLWGGGGSAILLEVKLWPHILWPHMVSKASIHLLVNDFLETFTRSLTGEQIFSSLIILSLLEIFLHLCPVVSNQVNIFMVGLTQTAFTRLRSIALQTIRIQIAGFSLRGHGVHSLCLYLRQCDVTWYLQYLRQHRYVQCLGGCDVALVFTSDGVL